MAEEHSFPTEVIDLPSKGKLYPKDSPLSDGKLELKYMTAKEEDILTSQNLIKKGIVLDKLMDSLIVTKGVKSDDLVLGDKNAVMVAARILAYGPEYTAEIKNPNTGELTQYTFDLSKCPFKEITDGIDKNEFKVTLPVSKTEVSYRILTGKDERLITAELEKLKKLKTEVNHELTTRLRYMMTSVDGDSDTSVITKFSKEMLARDSMFLRQIIKSTSPDIDLRQEIDMEGETVTVDIPMTVSFFWPSTEA